MSMKLAESAPSTDLAELDRVSLLSKQRPVWLRVGQLIDGLSDHPMHGADLVFDARQIHFVGTEGKALSPKLLAEGQNAPDAVLSDCTLLPCLIEAHAHLFLDGAPIDSQTREEYLRGCIKTVSERGTVTFCSEDFAKSGQSPTVSKQPLKQPGDWMLARARSRWPKILQTGVGAVRDAGDKHGVGLALAAEAKIHRGQLASIPWYDSPGAAIHHRGRYGSFMADPLEDYQSEAECVAARVAAGADRIKLLVSGIINFKVGQVTTPPQMSAVEVAALVDAARSHGRQTFAHASGAPGIENSIEGGVTTVEHGFFMTVDQLAKMRDRQITWVPTFAPVQLQIDRAANFGWNETVVGHLERIIENHGRTLCKAHDMGVRVVAGSDAGSCGVPHGIGLVQELCLMERAGVSCMAVLRAATGVSATTLAFAEPIGQIAPGCRSRFILTRHSPLATVANLLKEKCIVFDGQALQCPSDLDTEGL